MKDSEMMTSGQIAELLGDEQPGQLWRCSECGSGDGVFGFLVRHGRVFYFEPAHAAAGGAAMPCGEARDGRPLPGLAPKQAEVLARLAEHGPMGIPSIMGATGLTASAVYNACARLEEAGLVERDPKTKVRRLTDAGRRAAGR